MTHSEQALQWLSEGKTVLLAGKEVDKLSHGLIRWSGYAWNSAEFDTIAQGFVDAGLPLTCKEPEPKVRIGVCAPSGHPKGDGYTYLVAHIKGNVTEAQVKAALESIGGKQ